MSETQYQVHCVGMKREGEGEEADCLHKNHPLLEIGLAKVSEDGRFEALTVQLAYEVGSTSTN